MGNWHTDNWLSVSRCVVNTTDNSEPFFTPWCAEEETCASDLNEGSGLSYGLLQLTFQK